MGARKQWDTIFKKLKERKKPTLLFRVLNPVTISFQSQNEISAFFRHIKAGEITHQPIHIIRNTAGHSSDRRKIILVEAYYYKKK